MNPFDSIDSQFFVLVNSEDQYSLWPEFAQAPPGWTPLFGPSGKGECLEYIKRMWVDMRPMSLREFMSRKGDG